MVVMSIIITVRTVNTIIKEFPVIWLFSILTALSLMYIIHAFMKVDRNAALSGLFLVLLAFCMEFLNQWLGPFWIAQRSIYLISAGLPIEKLLLYGIGGTFACMVFMPLVENVRIRWAIILGIGLSMAAFELVLNQTMVFRWIRPWTVVVAFIYYVVGTYLLFRFYFASLRAKAITYSLLTLAALLLGTIHFSSEQIFPLVR